MCNQSQKIKISFPNHANEEVTGSGTLVKYNDTNILLEFGLNQSEKTLLADYRKNSRVKDFKPKDIDYIIVCHCHIDHIGLIPRLYALGCQAEILAPTGTKELFQTMCFDSAYILGKNADSLTKKQGQTYEPLYTNDHVELALEHWNEFIPENVHTITKDFSLSFLPSGHIINSYQAYLSICNSGCFKSILYTSDLGNVSTDQYYVNKLLKPKKADLIIGECTYCDSKRKSITHKTRKKDLEKIESVITSTCLIDEGRVLIPCFSLHRTQQMLTHLYGLFHEDENFNIPIIVDSMLALKVNNIFLSSLQGDDLRLFQKVLQWSNVKIIREFVETKGILASGQPAIFLSASGFLTGGHSPYIASQLLPHTRDHIIFVGYSGGEGSLPHKIQKGEPKFLTVEGKSKPNKCNVTCLHSFSSHMQHDDLIEYYTTIHSSTVALVHGDKGLKDKFAQEIRNEFSAKNKTTKVVSVTKGTTIHL